MIYIILNIDNGEISDMYATQYTLYVRTSSNTGAGTFESDTSFRPYVYHLFYYFYLTGSVNLQSIKSPNSYFYF